MKEKIAVLQDFIELTKPGICGLALTMTCLGFFLGSGPTLDKAPLFISLIGIGLVGAASCTLNQYIERDIDARMWRTLDRPLPAGRLKPSTALIFGVVTAIAGELVLFFGVNTVTAALAALTIFFYLAIYTPSKRKTSLSTLLGAVPGAMPPLMGWTAVQGKIGFEGLVLFGILFLWQIPHFLAIAWMYREDYARADLPVLPVVDELGGSTVKQVITYSLFLLPISLIPTATGLTGLYYFYGAMALGVVFLLCGVALAIYRSKQHARRLFFASIIYLPLLGFLMVWDRTF